MVGVFFGGGGRSWCLVLGGWCSMLGAWCLKSESNHGRNGRCLGRAFCPFSPLEFLGVSVCVTETTVLPARKQIFGTVISTGTGMGIGLRHWRMRFCIAVVSLL